VQIDLTFTPAELAYCDLRGKIAVVIDVFRFTTAALAALEAGAAGIYVVKEVEEAIELRAKDPRLLLAGERRALKVPGFDFGNSPLEFTNRVQGRRIVWCTTNGTNAVTMAAAADEVILASLRSAAAAAEYLSARKKDCILVPAGLRGRYSLEDTWCAGYIARQLEGCAVSDSAQTAMCIAEHWSLRDLSAAQHGQVLLGLGMAADVEYCLALNASPNVIRQDPLSGWCTLA